MVIVLETCGGFDPHDGLLLIERLDFEAVLELHDLLGLAGHRRHGLQVPRERLTFCFKESQLLRLCHE